MSEPLDPRVLGQRLQEARKVMRLTQAQAADSIDVARTTLTAIEKGERAVRPAELVALAGLYRVSVNDLVRSSRVATPMVVQLRALNVAEEDSELLDAIAQLQGLCERYLELENLVHAPMSARYPAVYRSSHGKAEQVGEDVALAERNRLGMGDGPVLGLRRLLESDVGLRVFYLAMPGRIAGMFACSETFGGCIGVNITHPAERRRMTLAHEYGHFLLDRHSADIATVSGYQRSPRAEKLADSFCRNFLMPGSGLRRRFHDVQASRNGKITNADLCRLADQYKVSFEAMCRRLEELDLIRSGTFEILRERGFKPLEARQLLGLNQDREPRREALPERYRFLAVEAYHNELLSESQLAKFLGVDRLEARSMVASHSDPQGQVSADEHFELDLGQVVQ